MSLIDEERGYYEYTVIENFYAGGHAKRSGLPLMNHIDEGLALLKVLLHADEATKKAWCIHPIVQSRLWPWRKFAVAQEVVDVTNTYAHYANAYLPSRSISNVSEIECPLEGSRVHKMLVADKIQNRKDFEVYQEPNERLKQYFCNWMKRLDVHRLYPSWKMWLLALPALERGE